MKCANHACKIERRDHLWIVGGLCYCSPWCERNKGKHPNEVGIYKKVWLGVRRERKSS